MARPWILDYDSANCAIGATVDILGERPTFLVLREAFNGVRRFDDMQRRTGMPRQVLSQRLARLVPTTANGAAAFGQYRPDGRGGHRPWALQVVEVSGDRISGLHNFLVAEPASRAGRVAEPASRAGRVAEPASRAGRETELFAAFGLPARLGR